MRTIEATPLASAAAHHGGKAAGLSALLTAGFPVPPGVVFDAAPLASAPAIAAAAVDAARENGWRSVAVRSSSKGEDGVTSSGAGEFETVLNVPGDDVEAMTSAVDTVLASIGENGGVIVQQMVAAEAAGVVFTIDPVTGATFIIVNAVSGLGDALVSGAETPWETRIPRAVDGSVRSADIVADDGPIDRAALRELIRLALAAEDARHGPQDIEWAVADGVVWLLQSRPVTALAEQVPVEVVVPPGYWVRDPTHGRLPRTRMTASVIDEDRAVRPMVVEFGMLATFSGARIGGWHYVTIVPVGAPPPAPGKSPPRLPGWLVSLLIRGSREGRRQLRAARRAMKTDAAQRLLDEWNDRRREELRAGILSFQDVDLGGLDDAELADQLRERAGTLIRSTELHFRLAMPYSIGIFQLVDFCRAQIGWSAEETLDLLSGLADVASEPGRALAALAAMPPGSAERADAFEQFQRYFGCRALDIEVAEPTLAESPHLLNVLIDAARQAGSVDAEQAQAEARARVAARARARLRPARRAEFERLLATAERVYGLRDDNVFLTIDAPLAVVRYAALEVGRRLAARGTLDLPEDVFHLTPEEAAAALGSRDPLTDIRDGAQRERGERAWAIAHPGPISYGIDPGAPPRFTGLTRAERTPTEAEMLMGELIMPRVTADSTGQDGVLRGTPASAGRVTGTARIVHSEADFHVLEPGDIVVCPGTRPSWSVIFPMIGGLVADAGGSLSHPAIIAREYGIPAVVAAVGATDAIRDGEVITVDGGEGTIRRHAFPPRR
ncbi:PEP/pyruvate-binding domain-containing protein [Microbacterium pumilum]|uniref:PEP/pyruvate-binding domain-containing protein n=1 Tax=Microbacterium pumilum TaxID=344165 RepID=A0ABN2S0V7_9MICO